MKRILFSLALAGMALGGSAQQNVEQRRSHTVFEFPSFRAARIIQPFGRFVTDTINIFLGDASLRFFRDGQLHKADLSRIVGIQVDGRNYRTVDGQMGLVIAEENYNFLLRVTTINRKLLESETAIRERQDYLEVMPGVGRGLFLELDRIPEHEEDKDYPLKETYYFLIGGVAVQAREPDVKKHVRPEKKKEFKKLVNDHYWSWNDAQSLAQLLTFF